MRVDGSAPMRRGLVLARSFFMPPAIPAHPSTRKPHAGGKALEACPQGATPYGEPHAGRHSKALPPTLRGERCAPPMAARSLFVRCRPLLGGVRWAARGRVNMCHAVWCVPVRMGIVLARSFFYCPCCAHPPNRNAAGVGADAARAAKAAHFGAPISPKSARDRAGAAEKSVGAHPSPCPPKIQHSAILASPSNVGAVVSGLANMAEYWGAGRGVASTDWGAPLKPRPPLSPFPPGLRRAFAAGVGAAGGWPRGGGGLAAPSPSPGPPAPPPLARLPRAVRASVPWRARRPPSLRSW